MKARNPNTGQFEEVYVKALDSLPVGTTVEYTGSSSDIPTGWEAVSGQNKIIKTSENRALAGRVVNIKNSSTTDSYSSDYMNTKFSEDAKINPKAVNPFYYYVNASTGNDNNDGLTTSTPFKTIDKLFSLINGGQTDIRAYFMTSDDYVIHNVRAISNVSFHFNNYNNSNPNIVFDITTSSIAFYECHVNFKNLKLSQARETDNRIYFEGCTVGLTNVDATGSNRLGFIGSDIEVTDLTCKRLQLDKTSGFIENLTITNTSNSLIGVEIEFCSGLRLFGNLNVSNLEGTPISYLSTLLNIIFSDVNLMFTLTNEMSSKYYYGIRLINSLCYITKNRLNYLNNYCGLNPAYIENSSLIQHNMIDTDWIDITPTHGTAHTNIRYKPQYRVKNGILYIHGIVEGLTLGDIIFTIPNTYPIIKRYTFPTASDNIAEYNYIRINESGEVSLLRSNMTNPTVILDGIELPLDY